MSSQRPFPENPTDEEIQRLLHPPVAEAWLRDRRRIAGLEEALEQEKKEHGWTHERLEEEEDRAERAEIEVQNMKRDIKKLWEGAR